MVMVVQKLAEQEAATNAVETRNDGPMYLKEIEIKALNPLRIRQKSC